MLRSHLVIFLILVWSFSVHAIVSGTNVLQTEYDDDYPYMVSIRASVFAEDHYCGGTVLSARWVLTAAHCLVKSETTQEGAPDNPDAFTNYDVALPKEVTVTQGVADLEATGISNFFSVTHVVIHPDYYPLSSATTTAYQNDLALLHVERDLPAPFVTLVDSTSYADLLALGDVWDVANRQSNVRVLGWGDGDITEADPIAGDSNSELRQTDVAFDPIADCFARTEAGETTPKYIASESDPTKLCTMSTVVTNAQDQSYGNGACIGDSGGPLLHQLSAPLIDNAVQVGVISASPVSNTICSSPTYPAWYTNINYYLDWIASYRDAAGPPEETVIKPTFLTTVAPDPDDDTGGDVETPVDEQQCNSGVGVGVGGGTTDIGCASSNGGESGSVGLLSLISILLLWCRRQLNV